MLGQKKTIDSYVENDIFQIIGEYYLYIARMINILHAKIKCNIVKYKLNVYKTSTKQPYLSCGKALYEVSIFRISYCQN